jgi:hypothetical protein
MNKKIIFFAVVIILVFLMVYKFWYLPYKLDKLKGVPLELPILGTLSGSEVPKKRKQD